MLPRHERAPRRRHAAHPGGLAIELAEDASAGVVHPLELDAGTLARWGEVLSDYQILQPFRQIGRDVYAPPDGERRAAYLDTRLGFEVEPGRVIGLESRGWQRGQVVDGGIMAWMEKRIGQGFEALIEIEPGLMAGMVAGSGPQRVAHVRLRRHASPAALDDLPPVIFSELVRDVLSLRS